MNHIQKPRNLNTTTTFWNFMKNLLILSALFLSSINPASANLQRDLQELSQLVDTGTNGDPAFIGTYNVKKFSYKPLVKELLEKTSNECKFTPLIGKKAVLSNLSSFGSLAENPEAIAIIKRLNNSGQLKAALGFYWNGENGETEYCLEDSIELYFTDGTFIAITFNSTT